jgi:protein phosphatase
MGTTMTACMLGDDDRLYVVHVGDSRAYLIRDGDLRRLTDDHSVVAELVRGGALTEEQADRHPQRNVITRALGASDKVRTDAFQVGVEPGDVVLLCTDGISAAIGDAGIRDVLAATDSLEGVALALLAAADGAGGDDNATVVLARVGEGPAAAVPAGPSSPAGRVSRRARPGSNRAL